MKYLCTSCNYVYDKTLWDKEEGLVVWEELELCPVCWEYDSFQWIKEEINYLDENTLEKLEQDHMPIINFKWDILEIRVWREAHPMWEDHRISYIWFYDEYGDIVDEKFLNEDDDLVCEFDISDIEDWEIRIKCSQHGIWSRKFERN